MPCDPQDVVNVTQVESIQSPLLPYNKVLTTQVLYTVIFADTVSLVLAPGWFVGRAMVVAAFPIFLLISLSREKFSVIVDLR